MQPSDFDENKSGRLISTPQGYWAFVPSPLPPRLDITWELASQISDADRALSKLGGIAQNLPNPHLLIAPFIRREAVLSSRIEGTQASLSDLFYFEASGDMSFPRVDVKEVMNYVNALEYGLERLKELPVSLRIIREMHDHLMRGVRGENAQPGDFRTRQNWIGSPGSKLMDATFVPPPEPEMKEALDQLEKYLHTVSNLPPLVRLAIIHYQFEAIHPFQDGNGRIGRLLITLLLCAENLLPQPLLYLSAFFERHRQDYYRLLLGVSQRGAWSDWIVFFLRGVTEQAHDSIVRSDRLLSLWQSYRQKFQAGRSSGLLLRLVDDLFVSPVLTIPQAAQHLNAAQKIVGLNVEKLVKHQVLREITGKQRYRVFMASEIIQAIEDDKATAFKEGS